MSQYHVPVLLQEAVDYLNVQSGSQYIDATLGGAGHTGAILEKGGRVLSIDVDTDALNHVEEKFKIGEELILAQGNFRDIGTIAHSHTFKEVAGILFDLGVSSYQFDTQERGFSFQKDAPLDMRMDLSLGVQAADLINGLNKKELFDLFTKYGEEPFAYRIVDAILFSRKEKKIETTQELAEIIRQAVKGHFDIHPATRVFQALRIVVNDELNNLKSALPQAHSLLRPGGRLVVISFHSLEDKIVKDFFKEMSQMGKGIIITGKPIMAREKEVLENRRSRSAKLRVLEKI